MNPFVSVIIPNYNHSPYLAQRIDSVLNQTYRDFEVIILDDCSTDDSRDIIEQYRNHPKVSKIVYNETNSGSTFKQWQKGIELAKGEWIWIAESDDWCEPTILEELTMNISTDIRIGISVCSSLTIRNNTIYHNHLFDTYTETINGKEFIRRYLTDYNAIVNASMAIFRRSLALENIIKSIPYNYCGDWIFWIHLSSVMDIKVSGKVLNYFRKHDHDQSSKAYKQLTLYAEYLTIAETILELNIIDYPTYKKHLYKKWLSLKSKNHANKEILNDYKKVLGISFILLNNLKSRYSYLKRSINQLLKVIK